MIENINTLDEIHKGSCMGMDAIDFVMDKVEDAKFKKELRKQYKDYQKIAREIEDIYPKYNDGKPHETSTMNKVMTWSGIEMRTMNDNSNSKIAELLIKGVNMGIIEGKRILNKKKMNREVETIVAKYVKMQEQSMEDLKGYL